MKPSIAFLGIGKMGAPMALRLLAAGFHVTAWNRSRGKADALAPAGAGVATTSAEAVQGADIAVTMLENGPIVADVLFGQGAAAALKRGATVVDMSSIKPREAREHAARLEAIGCRHVDAPVSGGTIGAEQGTLAIMAGGHPDEFAALADVFAPMGRATLVGPHGAGQLAKLANQMIVGITIGAVAEALLLVERGGANPAAVRNAIRGGFAESRILEVHGERMVARDFAARGAAAVHLKDFDNILDAAAEIGMDVPISQLLRALFKSLCDHGGAGVDHSGLFLELERRNAAPGNIRFP